ncbi:MAG: TetR/AcrR family transcriptional regulator, partial [Gracilibacteraceae bacterium]|nr:TetR/AcrR family transcriptional regulator [Gracilibacteraceae bacterium]
MNGYEKRTDVKKKAILAAARELFAARGLRDVHVNEIAKLANVSQVSIYNYFGDKNSLAREALAASV